MGIWTARKVRIAESSNGKKLLLLDSSILHYNRSKNLREGFDLVAIINRLTGAEILVPVTHRNKVKPPKTTT